MTDLALDVVSAHPDYTPNKVDYEIAKEVLRVDFYGYTATVSLGADDSAFLWWTDGVNEMLEHFVHPSHAIARLAHIQHCSESGYGKSINSHPRMFSEKFEFLMQDRWI